MIGLLIPSRKIPMAYIFHKDLLLYRNSKNIVPIININDKLYNNCMQQFSPDINVYININIW